MSAPLARLREPDERLPALTVLVPSTRYYQQEGRRHKKFTDWARQMVMQLRRWLPQRPLALVGDNSYAVLDLLHCCQSIREPVTLIARLRLDAALYAPAPPRQPGQNGRPPLSRMYWRLSTGLACRCQDDSRADSREMLLRRLPR